MVSQGNDIPIALFHSGPSSPIPSSSSSCSPPSYNKFIPDDVSIIDHRRSLQAGVMNARLLQDAVNAAKMKPIIRNYLLGGGDEKTVVILTSKVAQKSYGTEKRYKNITQHPHTQKKYSHSLDFYALHLLLFSSAQVGGQVVRIIKMPMKF